MPEGGALTIASQKSNGNLQISFVDCGVGMKKEIGMGFGLSAAKWFVA